MSIRLAILLQLSLLLASCSFKKTEADALFYNGKIYTVDQDFSVKEAMAVKDGKIVGTGSEEELFQKFDCGQKIDLHGRSVYPGFIDAHCHFLGYGLGLGRVNLVGTRSFEEVLSRAVASAGRKSADENEKPQVDGQTNRTWILGRGWDQNDWRVHEMPDRRVLDSLFPDRPVMLTRIDGHAALVNGEALRLAGIDGQTKISGGEIVIKNGEPTGLLVDNAVDLVKSKIPAISHEEKKAALLNAQANCVAQGLTTVVDAGLMKEDIEAIADLQKSGRLKVRVYAMLSDSAPNYEHFLKQGPLKTEQLNVRSFKFYVDGALGSRGACLFEDYSDKPGWKGFLLNKPEHFESQARLLAEKGFQMNSHCIGDSAVTLILRIYRKYCRSGANRRWRIEHSQVVRDFKLFNNDIIPSVQPTHATSDMYWAAERLGSRVKNAYAYQKLLQSAGLVALGTDFPVEDISPFKTFYAAVYRKDLGGHPPGGFQIENALSREQTLKGMTIWAAYANFEEGEKGSLEKGKFADFVVLDRDIMKCAPDQILGCRVLSTYINGEAVFEQR